jgi:hypothetical protein
VVRWCALSLKYAGVLKDTGDYIGYCGFQYCSVLKDIEILYGYALEAAQAVKNKPYDIQMAYVL